MMTTNEQEVIAREIDQELAALARKAKAARLDVLGYMIDMARIEAGNATGQWPTGPI